MPPQLLCIFALLIFSTSLFSGERSNDPQDNKLAEPLRAYQITPINYQRIMPASNARETWKQNKLIDYVFIRQNKCYCDLAKNAQIYVLNNKIIQVIDLDNKKTYTQASQLKKYKTINQLFDFIDSSLLKHPDKIDINHDRFLGFPSRILIDPRKKHADDETNITINDLQLLTKKQTRQPIKED